MSTMSTKRLRLSDQLRKAIETAPMTRYRLSKLSGVDQGLLGKFVRGERAGLRLDTVDAICEPLRLRLVAEDAIADHQDTPLAEHIGAYLVKLEAEQRRCRAASRASCHEAQQARPDDERVHRPSSIGRGWSNGSLAGAPPGWGNARSAICRKCNRDRRQRLLSACTAACTNSRPRGEIRGNCCQYGRPRLRLRRRRRG